jgi:DNA-binding MarR family transcriptional regulator
MPKSLVEPDVIAELERALARLPEIIEEVFERRLLEQILGESDEVSTAQLRTLRFLAGLDSGNAGFPVGQIATGLRISYPAATKAVDRLTERLLAERHRDDDDARTIRVRLTNKGRDLVERLVLDRRLALTRVLEKLGGEQPAFVLLSLLEAFISESQSELSFNPDTGTEVRTRPDTEVRTHPDSGVRTRPDTEVRTHSDTEVRTHSDTEVRTHPDTV